MMMNDTPPATSGIIILASRFQLAPRSAACTQEGLRPAARGDRAHTVASLCVML